MPNIDETLTTLHYCFSQLNKLKADLADVLHSPIPKDWKDDQQTLIEKQMETMETLQIETLWKLITFPPQHVRHFLKVDEFYKTAKYENSVFIMTKFPEGKTAQDDELKRVIQAVYDAVSACGFTPRIASEKRYHPGLWDNVEIYLLGCQRGIAIVESKYKHELNPNVTMEWGWMRGMGKDVLYLVEETFDLARADISGLLQDDFPWDAPEAKITSAIKSWLGC